MILLFLQSISFILRGSSLSYYSIIILFITINPIYLLYIEHHYLLYNSMAVIMSLILIILSNGSGNLLFDYHHLFSVSYSRSKSSKKWMVFIIAILVFHVH